MNKVMRQEKKFLLTTEDYRKYSALLEQVMLQDSHNGAEGYIIRSLYFDSIYDRDYFEKLDGIELRRKIRLRCYDPNADFAVLEMKQKQGAQQLKRSLRLTRADAALLCQGRYEVLLKNEEPFAAECYGVMNMYAYRPKTIVQYRRKAFIAKENKIRVTFDHTITATESCYDLFSTKLCMYPVLDPFHVVMEVKYNGFLLSYIQNLLNIANRSEISMSKYMMARSVGYKGETC